MSTPLHLARPGQFIDMHGQAVDLSPDLLAQLAATYDPAIYQAPLVIGHPKTNSPAFGHLASLEATPEGLFGVPINVDPAFADAVNSGRYPQRSLSFWPADHPASPTPGRPYVRHLGVLGATPPAIPGLRGADLADPDAGITTLAFSAAPISPPEDSPMPDLDPVALAAQATALAEQSQALTLREQALADREAAAAKQAEGLRRAAVIAFCDSLADEARIRPADIPALAEIVLRLEQAEPALCFAAADTPEAPALGAAWLRSWLSSLPPLVDLSERATADRAKSGGATLDDKDVVRRARAFRQSQLDAGTIVSFAEAVSAVEAGTDRS